MARKLWLMRHAKWSLGVCGWLLASAALAQAVSGSSGVDEVVAGEGPIQNLETLVVHGVQPGPGLWRVSRDGHVLWILGTVSPLPNGIEWQSAEVEEIIARSQQILLSPSVFFNADVGFFGKLALAPSAWKAMRNEGGAELADVLPPALYARWQVQKQRYLGGDNGISRKRPLFAAFELQAAAIKSAGLGQKPVIWPVVERAAKAAGIKPTATTLKLTLDDPKAAIREFRAGGIDDTVCLERTLTAVERDLPTLVERANAWAVGDIDALRQLPHEDAGAACMQSVTQSAFVRNRGYGDLQEQVRQHWLSMAETALRENGETFAMLPIDGLLAADGYLALLQARGYEIEAP